MLDFSPRSSHPFPLLLTIIPPTWKKWTFSWFFFVSDVPYQSLQYPMWRFFIAMHCKTNTFSLNRPKNNSSKNMIYSNEQQITAWQLTTLQDFFQISNQSSQPPIWRFPIGLRTILDSIGSHVDQLDWSRNNLMWGFFIGRWIGQTDSILKINSILMLCRSFTDQKIIFLMLLNFFKLL